MYEEIRKKLTQLTDDKYASLTKKLCPNIEIDNTIGIRTPELRKIAKKIVSNEYQIYLEEASKHDDKYHEEIILEGLVIGYAKIELTEKIKYIKDYIPEINNWIVTDAFTSTIKIKNEDELKMYWNFILPYLKSDEEYEVRYAVKSMLDNYIIDKYVDKVISKLDKIENRKYYVEMAMAWTLAEIGIKYNEKLMNYLTNENNLDNFTYNMTLQKMIDSRRVPQDQKELLKKMKRKE